MKLKPPKKPRRPDKFYGRDDARKEAQSMEVPTTGGIKLYLDDERPCPEGWTLVRSPKAFYEALDAMEDGRLQAMSLDWYLGVGIIDGEKIAENIVQRMKDRPGLFSRLDIIHTHSSNRDMACNMARTLAKPMREDWPNLPHFIVDVGHPHVPRLRRHY